MANVYLQDAARSLRMASDDVQKTIQQVKYDANQQKRDTEQRLNQVRAEEEGIQAQINTAQDDNTKAEFHTLKKRLDDEADQLQRTIASIDDAANKQIDALQQQGNQYAQLAGQIENSA